MSNMVFCYGCGKEIHQNAPICPHCGAPSKSSGVAWSKKRMVIYSIFSFALPVIGLVASMIGVFNKGTRKQGLILFVLALMGFYMYSNFFPQSNIDLSVAKSENIDPRGEIAKTFEVGGNATDIMRENKISEIKGKVIEWELTVNDVSKSENKYTINTDGDLEVSTSVSLSARDEKDKLFLENLKTGDSIKIKGVVNDVVMRTFFIEPAILLSNSTIKDAGIDSSQSINTDDSVKPEEVKHPNDEPNKSPGMEIIVGVIDGGTIASGITTSDDVYIEFNNDSDAGNIILPICKLQDKCSIEASVDRKNGTFISIGSVKKIQ